MSEEKFEETKDKNFETDNLGETNNFSNNEKEIDALKKEIDTLKGENSRLEVLLSTFQNKIVNLSKNYEDIALEKLKKVSKSLFSVYLSLWDFNNQENNLTNLIKIIETEFEKLEVKIHTPVVGTAPNYNKDCVLNVYKDGYLISKIEKIGLYYPAKNITIQQSMVYVSAPEELVKS